MSTTGDHKPRWVETVDGSLAVIVQEVATGLLIRYTSKRHSDYHWVTHSTVLRRADLDAHSPEPDWLTRARFSRRPPAILHRLLEGLDTRLPEANHLFPSHDFDTDPEGRPLEVKHD